MKSTTAALETTRGRVFFWIGMAILPVFWVWWMRAAPFAAWQRRIGWLWTCIYIGIGFFQRDWLATWMPALLLGSPIVAFRLTVALLLWLWIRTMRSWSELLGLLVSMDVLAILSSLSGPLLARMPQTPLVYLPVVILGVAHLLLDRVKARSATVRPAE